jgi:CheY-like chemotaxis protein
VDTYRILVVDDEVAVRNTLGRYFLECGFKVSVATDGAMAVEKSQRKRYDLITMDLRMPGMRGEDAIEAIREHRPNVPILVLTGFFEAGDDALARGASHVMSKPFSLPEVEAEIRKLLAEKDLTSSTQSDL